MSLLRDVVKIVTVSRVEIRLAPVACLLALQLLDSFCVHAGETQLDKARRSVGSTLEVQSRVDAAARNGGGVVKLKGSTYVGPGVRLRSRVRLECVDARGTAIRLASGSGGDVIDATGTEGAALVGCTIDGDKLRTVGRGYCVRATNSRGFLMAGVTCVRARNCGLQANGAVNLSADRCQFSENGTPEVGVSGGDGIIVWNSKFSGRITNCSMEHNWRNGISLDRVLCGNIILSHLLTSRNSHGVHIEDVDASAVIAIDHLSSISNNGIAYGAGKAASVVIANNSGRRPVHICIKDSRALASSDGIVVQNLSDLALDGLEISPSLHLWNTERVLVSNSHVRQIVSSGNNVFVSCRNVVLSMVSAWGTGDKGDDCRQTPSVK